MTDTEVVALMNSSGTPADWEFNARFVKQAHGGEYPASWYDLIVASGLADWVRDRWGDTGPLITVTRDGDREE